MSSSPTSYPRNLRESGITLVELLVVAPLIILLIATLIITIANLTGSSLFSQEKNNTVYNTQYALDDIDTSVRYATKFLSTTGALTSPQGRNNDTTAFTHDSPTDTYDTLIFTTAATDKSIYDSTRQLVYTGAGACDSTDPLYVYKTVYFVDPTSKALYKRTILPQPGALCRPISQKNSCATVSGTLCVARDEKLLDNVESLKIEYLATPGSGTTTTPDLAQVAVITITRSTKGGGEDVDYTGTLRASRVNINSVNETTTAVNPPITGTASATNAIFNWEASANATGYNISYRINSGSWVNGPQNTSQTSYTVPNLYRKQAAEVRVQAIAATGNFYYTNGSVTIPQWYECAATSKWNNYGDPYNTAGYTKTSSGVVGLKGLVKDGDFSNVASNQVGSYPNTFMCVLPVGFRPAHRTIFQSTSHDPTHGSGGIRVDIHPTGEVVAINSPSNSNGWVSLDGILFMTTQDGTSSSNLINPPASGSSTWQNGTYSSPWYFYNYNDPYASLGMYRDSRGRTWTRGIGTGGGTNTLTNLPASYRPQYGAPILPSASDLPSAFSVSPSGNSGNLDPRTGGNFKGLQLLFYSTGGLSSLPLSNGWVAYANGWADPRCFRGTDDIVIVQGLVRSGTSNAGAPMSTVTGCGSGTKTMSTGKNAIFPAWIDGERGGRIDMVPNGNLYAITSAPGYTSLDAVHYIAD